MQELFEKRRSVRKFLKKEVAPEVIREVLTAGMSAPSGCNTKGYELILIRGNEKLVELGSVGKWLDFIKTCNFAVAIIAKEYTFWVEDCSLVAGQMMLEAVHYDVGSCWGDIKDGMELDKTDREAKSGVC